jgi:hypothetical protein
LTVLDVSTPQTRAFETRRTLRGVGNVIERVISRSPAKTAAEGVCAGRVELEIPGTGQAWEAEVGCGAGLAKVRAFATDAKTGRRWLYQPTLDQMMEARQLLLADRSDGVEWRARDTVYEAASWTAVVHGLGHTHPPIDETGAPQTREMVLYMSHNTGTPAPGVSWDDVQVVLLDPLGHAQGRLVMDGPSMTAQAGIALHHHAGDLTGLSFAGMLRDGDGIWRFVDLWLPVQATDVAKGSDSLTQAVVAKHTAHVLRSNPHAPVGHIWVDGQEWLAVDALSGLVDQSRLLPGSTSLGGTLSMLGSPERKPAFVLAHAPSGSVLWAWDQTVAADRWGLLTLLPEPMRRGWSHMRDRVTVDGNRAPTPSAPQLASEPYASRALVFELPSGDKVRMTQSVVAARVADVEGLHYGLKQVVEKL